MRRPLRTGLLGGTLLALAIALPAAAGGWAAVVDDEALPPDDGGTTLIRFTLLQHGETPVDWGTLSVVAVHEETGRRVAGTASRETATPGGWVAAFRLPEAGSWVVEIGHEDLEITASGPIRISAAPIPGAPAGSAPVSGASAASWLGIVLVLVAVAVPAAAALLLAARRREGVATRASRRTAATG
jgi:hypothetical protein